MNEPKKRVAVIAANGIIVRFSTGLCDILGIPPAYIQGTVVGDVPYDVWKNKHLLIANSEIVQDHAVFQQYAIPNVGVTRINPESNGFQIHEFVHPYEFAINTQDVRCIRIQFLNENMENLVFLSPPLYVRLKLVCPTF